jgi:hypothetical protein
MSALGEGQWDIAALRALLERIAPDKSVLEDYEVELDFPRLGKRKLLLNARNWPKRSMRGSRLRAAPRARSCVWPIRRSSRFPRLPSVLEHAPRTPTIRNKE